MMRAYGVTDRGWVRAVNQDCFAIEHDLGLLIVADGMGGHNAGEVAARLAVETVVRYVRRADNAGQQDWPFGFNPSYSIEGNLLRTAIQLANVQIRQTAQGSSAHSEMGTTIVAALTRGDRMSIAHVGDSRLYAFDGACLRRLTTDDSWTATVLAHDPCMAPAVLRHHPLCSALTSAVGARADVDVHVVDTTLSAGERLLLSTDGLHDPLDDERIERLLREGDNVATLPESLVAAAMARGSRDNCTALVAEYVAD